jgi:hypothetical protein
MFRNYLYRCMYQIDDTDARFTVADIVACFIISDHNV